MRNAGAAAERTQTTAGGACDRFGLLATRHADAGTGRSTGTVPNAGRTATNGRTDDERRIARLAAARADADRNVRSHVSQLDPITIGLRESVLPGSAPLPCNPVWASARACRSASADKAASLTLMIGVCPVAAIMASESRPANPLLCFLHSMGACIIVNSSGRARPSFRPREWGCDFPNAKAATVVTRSPVPPVCYEAETLRIVLLYKWL